MAQCWAAMKDCKSRILHFKFDNYVRILTGMIFRWGLRENSDVCVMMLIVKMYLTRAGGLVGKDSSS